MIRNSRITGCILALTSCLSLSTWANIDYPHRPGELIVKLKDPSAKTLGLKGLGVLSEETISPNSGALLVKFNQKSDLSLEEMMKRIARDPNVTFVEPNYIYSIEKPVEGRFLYSNSNSNRNDTVNQGQAPSDPLFGQLWGFNNTGTNEPNSAKTGKVGTDIAAFDAWGVTKGSRQIKIAVIDTGIDYNHSDLLENIWVNVAEKLGKPGVDDDGNGLVDDIHGYDFANNDADPIDGHGHGTHCAGTIGAIHDNTIGIAGIMANVEIVAVKFLTDQGSGDSANAIKAIDYATSLNVDIMSNSWGGGAYSKLLEEAIQRASDAGIIFTAAAGNSADDNDKVPHYPANYDIPNIVSVAAHTAQDHLASFSCFGKESVDITAPGKSILSTMTKGSYGVLSGTSMATPHVTGALGLLLSVEGRMPHDEMMERLRATSVPVVNYRGRIKNGGRLNAYNLITNTRPLRVEPDERAWQNLDISGPWETAHPYGVNLAQRKSFKVPGAKFIRLVIKKLELEDFYDYLQIKDSQGNIVTQLTGVMNQQVSEYVEGEEINLLFKSDRSISKWGFAIEQVQWQ